MDPISPRIAPLPQVAEMIRHLHHFLGIASDGGLSKRSHRIITSTFAG